MPEDELLGQAHNLVRQPDMPQITFKELWDTSAKGPPWMGIVRIVVKTVIITGLMPSLCLIGEARRVRPVECSLQA